MCRIRVTYGMQSAQLKEIRAELPDEARWSFCSQQKPGTNVAQKAGLNRSILDAGWGQFRSILTGKGEEAGRTLIAVDPRYTSQTCLVCGHVETNNRINAVFRCLKCGHEAHADTNSACNILRAALARLATSESDVA